MGLLLSQERTSIVSLYKTLLQESKTRDVIGDSSKESVASVCWSH